MEILQAEWHQLNINLEKETKNTRNGNHMGKHAKPFPIILSVWERIDCLNVKTVMGDGIILL